MSVGWLSSSFLGICLPLFLLLAVTLDESFAFDASAYWDRRDGLSSFIDAPATLGNESAGIPPSMGARGGAYVVTRGSQIFVFGGWGGMPQRNLNDVWIFDTETYVWIPFRGPYFHNDTSALPHNGTLGIYDRKNLPTARYGGAAFDNPLSMDPRMLIFAGMSTNWGHGVFTFSNEVWDLRILADDINDKNNSNSSCVGCWRLVVPERESVSVGEPDSYSDMNWPRGRDYPGAASVYSGFGEVADPALRHHFVVGFGRSSFLLPCSYADWSAGVCGQFQLDVWNDVWSYDSVANLWMRLYPPSTSTDPHDALNIDEYIHPSATVPGTFHPSNRPGSRYQHTSWVLPYFRRELFCIYGGRGARWDSRPRGWMYNLTSPISTERQWALLIGVPDSERSFPAEEPFLVHSFLPSNTPGRRRGPLGWVQADAAQLYLFSGYWGSAYYNDLWTYSFSGINGINKNAWRYSGDYHSVGATLEEVGDAFPVARSFPFGTVVAVGSNRVFLFGGWRMMIEGGEERWETYGDVWEMSQFACSERGVLNVTTRNNTNSSRKECVCSSGDHSGEDDASESLSEFYGRFYGEFCELYDCAGTEHFRNGSCSNHGLCLPNTASDYDNSTTAHENADGGHCVCDKNYDTADCHRFNPRCFGKSSNEPAVCSFGGGRCVDEDVCSCFDLVEDLGLDDVTSESSTESSSDWTVTGTSCGEIVAGRFEFDVQEARGTLGYVILEEEVNVQDDDLLLDDCADVFVNAEEVFGSFVSGLLECYFIAELSDTYPRLYAHLVGDRGLQKPRSSQLVVSVPRGASQFVDVGRLRNVSSFGGVLIRPLSSHSSHSDSDSEKNNLLEIPLVLVRKADDWALIFGLLGGGLGGLLVVVLLFVTAVVAPIVGCLVCQQRRQLVEHRAELEKYQELMGTYLATRKGHDADALMEMLKEANRRSGKGEDGGERGLLADLMSQLNMNPELLKRLVMDIAEIEIISVISGFPSDECCVYLARMRTIQELIVLKYFAYLTKKTIRLFIAEFKALAFTTIAGHPNIITFYGFALEQQMNEETGVEEPVRLGLCIEYAEGGDLADFLNKNVKIAIPTKIRLLRELAAGMAFLHSKKLVHRDLKPQNVLLTRNLVVKIIDFGLSRFTSDDLSAKTRAIGTSYWMAPELIVSESYSGPAVDVFAFGIMVFQFLAHTNDPYEAKKLHLHRVELKVANDSTFRPSLDRIDSRSIERFGLDWLVDLMVSCWSHEAGDRPTFLQILKSFEDNPILDKPSSIPTSLGGSALPLPSQHQLGGDRKISIRIDGGGGGGSEDDGIFDHTKRDSRAFSRSLSMASSAFGRRRTRGPASTSTSTTTTSTTSSGSSEGSKDDDRDGVSHHHQKKQQKQKPVVEMDDDDVRHRGGNQKVIVVRVDSGMAITDDEIVAAVVADPTQVGEVEVCHFEEEEEEEGEEEGEEEEQWESED